MAFRRSYATGGYTPGMLSVNYGGRSTSGYAPSYSSSQIYPNYNSSYNAPSSLYSNPYSSYGSSRRSSSLTRATSIPKEHYREKSASRSACKSRVSRESSPERSHRNGRQQSSRSSRRDGYRSEQVAYKHRRHTTDHLPRDPNSKRSKSSASSGYNSRASSVSERDSNSQSPTTDRKENGDIDYKKLYEEQLAENDRLMNRVRSYEKELRVARETLANNNKINSVRNMTAESEKRERRALERKLSEMEDELKSMQKLRSENEKLRSENRALTRVVSKLTTSASAASNHLSVLGK